LNQDRFHTASGHRRPLDHVARWKPLGVPDLTDEAANKIVEDVKRETAGPWHRGFGRSER
jgi:hypothetical protein